jgi:hypothetical protein
MADAENTSTAATTEQTTQDTEATTEATTASTQAAATTEATTQTATTATTQAEAETTKGISSYYKDEKICIYNYAQLQLVGSGEEVHTEDIEGSTGKGEDRKSVV